MPKWGGLDQYEPVQNRLNRFYADHPDGRTITELISYTDTQWVFRAEVYLTPDDEKPKATGYAEETVGSSPVNKTNACENAETSAIGRALANAGYASNAGSRPSREEMAKAKRGDESDPVQDAKRRVAEAGRNIGLVSGDDFQADYAAVNEGQDIHEASAIQLETYYAHLKRRGALENTPPRAAGEPLPVSAVDAAINPEDPAAARSERLAHEKLVRDTLETDSRGRARKDTKRAERVGVDKDSIWNTAEAAK